METITEHYGCLTKVEALWCLEDSGIQNTFILESKEAFPGYYGHFSKQIKPLYIYIISNQKLTLEEVSRMTSNVKKIFKEDFDAAHCEITIRNNNFDGIRITRINDYSIVKDLQTAYKDCGLSLKKKVMKVENEDSIIKLHKFYKLKALSDNVFQDMKLQNIAYFKVDKEISWDDFRKKIDKLRFNWDGNSFDAAKSFIYQNSEITDLVRIYSKELNAGFMEKIREAYFKYSY